ncbi:alpha/beta hydrolase [Urbifossiella limnaea]|uniref:Alpha/beta hydrolase family protein n=1 Tax=Urbifossiella limnaea TaxID=2528023 RepID=A0A517Y2R5_9BACT|nr:alpha/beta fold hydrolase [Urbifossiella limnaea]QDU24086.1 Alpha/beta hydrolase family protein [Urbifossiella limnaea]
MVFWLWVTLAVVATPPVAVGLGLAMLYLYLRWKYVPLLVRIFQEKPLFIVPKGQPSDAAEPVAFPAADGLTLRGCYVRTPAPTRKGVILFGLEFGSDRWACRQYCEQLVAAGYDVFTYEPRNQGDSDKDAAYEPLQWVTDKDTADLSAALKYLRARPDADPAGIGLFGISKGGSTGFVAAAGDRGIRCVVTDGAYATYTTLVPYMQKFVKIYSSRSNLQKALPNWFYGLLGLSGVRRVGRNRGVTYPSVEKAVGRMRQPLLMIHGEGDTYIKPDMARALFERAKGEKELWVVPKAKHNQALHVAGDEYHRRVVEFFDRHLARVDAEPTVPAGAD